MQVSTVLGAALPEERAQSGWTEGVAIWVAVIVVSLVGECSSCTCQVIVLHVWATVARSMHMNQLLASHQVAMRISKMVACFAL